MQKPTVEKQNDIGNGVRLAIFAVIAIIIQLIWFYLLIFHIGRKYTWFSTLINILALIIAIVIYSQYKTASIKMTWIILILTFPFLGVVLYLMMGLNSGTKKMAKRYERLDRRLMPYLDQDDGILETLEKHNRGIANECRYIRKYSGYPVYRDTDVTFYDDAAKGLEAQLNDLEKAENFIFMEYHAIEDSASFNRILSVLRKKAEKGVEVRVFYDYVGSMGFIGNRFIKKLEGYGIRCRVFNPVLPFINVFLNNRDHRKITVIDGKVGFTGGYNLADEYFHVTEPYGHWLDTGIRLEGMAVRSLTVTFLENWNAIRSDDVDDPKPELFLPEYHYTAKEKGYIQPFADSPMDNEQVGENVYINILRNAKKYAYFITPYLILTDEMISAFSMAAKSGVDVRLITPGIPDKKIVYMLTRSYYAPLAQSGVRIYEYTPGFCHAKQSVSDDRFAFCGTINLDYRSLYHHFENGAVFCGYQAVRDMKNQFDDLFPKCNEVTKKYSQKNSGLLGVSQLLLRLLAPLM